MTINPSPIPVRPSTIHHQPSTLFHPVRPSTVNRQPSTLLPTSLLFLLILLGNSSYSQGRKNDLRALDNLINSPALKSAHVGVLVYDDSLKQDIAAYQEERYFVPASNTKLFSLYAGLKYLGDSLVGIRYEENDTAVFVFPSGDPSLLHPDFMQQPVVDFLKKTPKKIYIVDSAWQEEPLGPGW
jgi:D-alanyl-D-alanine carboxypeptidase/D-alanyl-D-alanine-endopeptidase (penicillin-binding protein 4)